MLRPHRLKLGDRVAIVAPSSGAAHSFPHVLKLAAKNLERIFGLTPVLYPTATMSDRDLYLNPKIRAQDINNAFADPSIKAVLATIGGDDSVRILPHLDVPLILSNPKILMGYSDTTTLHAFLNSKGLVTFNGPSLMAGIAQLHHLPKESGEHIKEILFEAQAASYKPFDHWVSQVVDWGTTGYDGQVLADQINEGWVCIQGSGCVRGQLYGGCVEVLEFLKGSPFWPAPEFFRGKMLFLETSEEKPTVNQVKYMLRNYGSIGVLPLLRAILIGRPRGYSNPEKLELCQMAKEVVSTEFGLEKLPIVANMDFGHTDPQWILPLGVEAELDCDNKVFRLVEPAVL